ncbi:alpha/beta hydrolase [Dactylosporangium sp. NPDC051484]|uniref:alpha/beta fold hydrolase n=1 Tax=Dactylosporangium sp. NPDC051484 TaxID=3154942 RepID=UPI00344FC5F3
MTYAEVNGVSLWYEEQGEGEPLILLHGGFWTIEMFGPLLPALAARRRVIAVELQGHGHTPAVDRPLRYETLGDDVAALIRHLGLVRADVMGYSLGAGAALRTAMQHPDQVRRLIVVSAPMRRLGWFPEVPGDSARPHALRRDRRTLSAGSGRGVPLGSRMRRAQPSMRCVVQNDARLVEPAADWAAALKSATVDTPYQWDWA